MISYTSFIQKFYQTLPHEIAKQTNWDVKVLVPPYWKELWSRGKSYLEKNFDELYDVITGNIWFAGNLHLAIFKKQLKWLIKAYQPNIIDLEDEPFNLGSAQIAYYRNRYSPHSQIILHASQHQFKKYPLPFNYVEKYALNQADAILARNQLAVEVLRKKDFRGILKIVTHGVNTQAFCPRELPELYRQLNPEKKPLIGFVGALEKHKGLHYLLDAVAGLDVKIILIGNGEYSTKLRSIADYLDLDVQFIDRATHEEVAQYMNCMDIFVLPSLTRPNWVEKFGRVLIEAMSSAVPVVGSNSGEIPNVIGDAGLIFKEANVPDLRRKIRQLIENKQLRSELGWKGRRRVLQKYSWKKIASQTINVYNHLLKTN